MDIVKPFIKHALDMEPNLRVVSNLILKLVILSATDGVEVFDGDTFTDAEFGASIPVGKVSAKAKFEDLWGDDA